MSAMITEPLMKYQLNYNGSSVELEIPSSIKVDSYAPVEVEQSVAYPDFDKSLWKANGAEWLRDPSPLIVVNDSHRSTPTSQLLNWLERYEPGLVAKASYLIAAGSHQAPTQVQLESIFGPFLKTVRPRIAIHDAHDLSTMGMIGDDQLGGEVWINKRVLDADRIIVLSSVEPHYFAGFTGGRKSLFPGLTDMETIKRNHNLANSLEARPVRLEGNPMAEHLESLLAMVDSERIRSIQVVLDGVENIVGIYAGSIQESFIQATEKSRQVFSIRAPERYDLVLCEMCPPLDADLYQAQKGLENCQAAVRDGGAAIVVSSCRDGVGSTHFFDLATSWDRQSNRSRDGRLEFGSHKLSRVIGIADRIDVQISCELDDATVRHVFYEPVGDIRTCLKERIAKGGVSKMAIVHDAGNTVLITQ